MAIFALKDAITRPFSIKACLLRDKVYRSGEKDATVYFRVSDEYKNVRITVKDGDDVVYTKKKQKVAPGEMESITLTEKLVKEVKSGKLTFSLEVL